MAQINDRRHLPPPEVAEASAERRRKEQEEAQRVARFATADQAFGAAMQEFQKMQAMLGAVLQAAAQTLGNVGDDQETVNERVKVAPEVTEGRDLLAIAAGEVLASAARCWEVRREAAKIRDERAGRLQLVTGRG